MGVSKKCKICTSMEENMSILGEYFGKQIPNMIEEISGIELDSRKASGVLICHQCAITLVHTESVVCKLRKSLMRLTKANKPARIRKTPSKSTDAETKVAGSVAPVKKAPRNISAKANGEFSFRKISDDSILEDDKLTPAKESKPVKRKLDSEEYDVHVNGNSVTPKPNDDHEATKFRQEIPDESANIFEADIELKSTTGKQKKVGKTSSQSAKESVLEEQVTDENYMNSTSGDNIKIKELNCVLCGKKFNQKSILREHIETSHMGEKLKECPNCSMEFRSLQKYESHVFSEKCKSTLHPCQFENCHKRFKNVTKMEAHMRERHMS